MSIRQFQEWLTRAIVSACSIAVLLVCAHAESAPPDGKAAKVSRDLRRRANLLRPSEHGVGQLVSDTAFLATDGKAHSLGEFRSKDLVVVAMTSTSCPLSRKYLPTLTKLAQKYSAQNVQFIAVNCVPTDRTTDVQAAAKAFGETTLYVHDKNEQLAQQVGALTTTDVLVLDAARTVVYHGAVDDQYGIGYALDAPRRTFLATAMDALLAGHTPNVAATTAPGCLLNHDSPDSEVSGVTYHNRVSRIMQQNCIECHRSGGVGPFPLDTYADVVAHAPMIRDVVKRRTMPPWFATESENRHESIWANDRSLSDTDRSDLMTWIEGGRTEGDASNAPVPRTFSDEWSLGEPDYVVQIPEPIDIKATGTMRYQNVKTETTFKEDKWVQGYEIVPTDRSVVHHVLVNVREKGTGRIHNREDGVGGYWAAYVPGNTGQLFPPGFAKKLPAGSTVTFQIHYTPNGEATQDQLKMGLIFAEAEPEYVVTTIPLADVDLNIPPHAENHVETITRPVPSDINVMAYMAHMHVRGKAFKFELITPDGETETLLDLPQYDFNWQIRYDYREPRTIPKGSRMKVTAVYDNSKNNPANPDPTSTVHWGEQTHEEMLIGYVETFAPIGQPRPTMINQEAGAFFTLLDADGDEVLSKVEATKAMSRVRALRNNPIAVGILFSGIDEDKDGFLSTKEFVKLRQALGQYRKKK